MSDTNSEHEHEHEHEHSASATRGFAVLEVVLVTAFAHFAYKASKLLEPAGSNLTPGLILLGTALLLMRVHRHRVNSFGVHPLPGKRALVIAAVLTSILVAGACARVVPASRIVTVLIERLVGAGLAEEFFFRGYVQSRVDAAFGRPWKAIGTHVGPGLVLAAVLFGAIHVFNPTLWYQGRYDVDLGWGLSALLSSLVFGWLRERSRGIWLPACVHGFLDVLKQLWIV